MDLVFSTDDYVQSQRYNAWRDAICDVYVHVDVAAVALRSQPKARSLLTRCAPASAIN